jgi:hypothetical protein
MDMFPGWAKRMAELQVRPTGSNMAKLRRGAPCNVYGPGDSDRKMPWLSPA